MTILTLTTQAANSRYDYLNKKAFARAARSFLRDVAKRLTLPKGSFDIRYNEGGIAGSGDAILHGESFYVHLNDFGCYWRKCKGRKDYCGEYNRWPHPELAAKDFAAEIGVAIGVKTI